MAFINIRRFFPLVLALQWNLNMYGVTTSFNVFVAAQYTNTTLLSGGDDGLADFGQIVPILGQMERTDQDFKDGLALDLFSPHNRTLVVHQNTSPLPGNFVSGSSGEPFVALSSYSWVIKVNDTARDLIAKVELPYDPEKIQRESFNVANMYVGILSEDGKSWVVDESRRNVHISENKTRIIKMTSLDGEYILLGRQTVDTANIFVQYGFGATRTVNLTGGKGVQQSEFVDGLRLAVELEEKMRINVDLKYGIDPRVLPTGMRSLYSFTWAINSSAPDQQLKRASVRFPVNISLLSPSNNGTSANIIIARRDLHTSFSASFEPISQLRQKVNRWPEYQVEVLNLRQLDGEYAVLVADKGEVKLEGEVVQEPSSSPAASSISATLRKDTGWMWTLLSMSLCAIFVSSLTFF